MRKLSAIERQEIELAIEEAYANVVRHAYKGTPDALVVVGVHLSGLKLSISLSDEGQPFEAADLPELDIEAHYREGKTGGLGLYMIRSLMDEVVYRRVGIENQILMAKYLGREVPPALASQSAEGNAAE